MIYKKLRNRILLFVILVTLSLFFFVNYNNYKEKEQLLYDVSIEKLLILTKLSKTYKDKVLKLYIGRFATLNGDEKLKKILQLKDKKEIQKYAANLQNRYKKFTSELNQFNIYNRRGEYFYSSDYTEYKIIRSATKNPVLQESLRKKELITGYVLLNKKDYYYSMICPIKSGDKILAYVEFGLKADNLFKVISKAGRFKYALYVNETPNSDKRTISTPTATNSKLFTALHIDQEFIYTYANNNKIVKYNDKYYLFHQFDIERSFQRNFAQVVMATNVTRYVQQNQETSLRSFLVLFVVLLFIYLLIYLLFTKLINVLLKEEQQLALKQEQLQVIMDNSNSLITLFEKGKLIIANNALLDFTEFNTLEELLREHDNLSKIFIEDDETFSAPKAKNNLEWIEALSKLKEEQKIVMLKNKKFGISYFSVKTKVVPNQENTIIVIFSNVSSLFKKSKKDEYLAYHDNLTGIYNRQYLNQSIAKAITDFKENGSRASLLMLDIDFFKKVNDTYGHQVGDDVLIKFTQTISEHIRSKDIFARWGGEEFVILLGETDIKTAQKVAQHLVTIIAAVDFTEVGQVTCSIGVSELREEDSADDWIMNADKALYMAKENGRNRVEVVR